MIFNFPINFYFLLKIYHFIIYYFICYLLFIICYLLFIIYILLVKITCRKIFGVKNSKLIFKTFSKTQFSAYLYS